MPVFAFKVQYTVHPIFRRCAFIFVELLRSELMSAVISLARRLQRRPAGSRSPTGFMALPQCICDTCWTPTAAATCCASAAHCGCTTALAFPLRCSRAMQMPPQA